MLNILYEYGPLLLSLLSWYLLWNYATLFYYYTIGIFINIILNIIIKGIVQEPRPEFDNNKIKLLKTNASHYFFQNGIPFNIYGMPSGHAQLSFFTSIFMILSLKHKNWSVFYLLFSLLICYQRVNMNEHSISQVLVGIIIGSCIGHSIYKFAVKKMKGKIRERADDFGPI